MSLTDIAENSVLDSLFGDGSPASYDLALSTTPPNDNGTNFTEPVGNGYARETLTNNATTFPAASGGQKTNGIVIEFTAATGPWAGLAPMTHWGLYDGGTLVIYGVLNPSKVINTGDILRISSGAMVITAD